MINVSHGLNNAMPFIRHVLTLVASHLSPSESTVKSAREVLHAMDRHGVLIIPGMSDTPRPPTTRAPIDVIGVLRHFKSHGVRTALRHQLLSDEADVATLELTGTDADLLDALWSLNVGSATEPSAAAEASSDTSRREMPTLLEVATDVARTVHVGLTELGELPIDDQADLESALSYALAVIRRHKAANRPAADDGTLRLLT